MTTCRDPLRMLIEPRDFFVPGLNARVALMWDAEQNEVVLWGFEPNGDYYQYIAVPREKALDAYEHPCLYGLAQEVAA